jgi:hypothetical protein
MIELSWFDTCNVVAMCCVLMCHNLQHFVRLNGDNIHRSNIFRAGHIIVIYTMCVWKYINIVNHNNQYGSLCQRDKVAQGLVRFGIFT